MPVEAIVTVSAYLTVIHLLALKGLVHFFKGDTALD